MDIIEEFISYIISDCLKHCSQELEILERDLSKLKNISSPFPRISYDDAVKILKDKNRDFKYGSDFGAPDEEAIASEFDKRFSSFAGEILSPPALTIISFFLSVIFR